MKRVIKTTTQTVVEEYIKPRKAAIRKRVKVEKAIAGGISLGFMIVSAMIFVKVMLLVYQTLTSRFGLPGGELLVFPALVLAFFWGWDIANTKNKWMEESGNEGSDGNLQLPDYGTDGTAGEGRRGEKTGTHY